MDAHADKWIEERILWAARKNGLPTGLTSIYKESNALPADLVAKAESGTVGIPVLAAVSSESRWNLLGTARFLAMEDGIHKEVALVSIADVRMPDEGQVAQKSDCDFVILQDDAGNTNRFWVPSGKEFFAFCNILLRLKNLRVK